MYDDGPECEICYNEYDDYRTKKVMPCGHAGCFFCLSLLIDDYTSTIKCPMCRSIHKFNYKFKFLKPPPRLQPLPSPPQEHTLFIEFMFVKMFILFAIVVVFKIYEREDSLT
jgi:hypothetical protein